MNVPCAECRVPFVRRHRIIIVIIVCTKFRIPLKRICVMSTVVWERQRPMNTNQTWDRQRRRVSVTVVDYTAFILNAFELSAVSYQYAELFSTCVGRLGSACACKWASQFIRGPCQGSSRTLQSTGATFQFADSCYRFEMIGSFSVFDEFILRSAVAILASLPLTSHLQSSPYIYEWNSNRTKKRTVNLAELLLASDAQNALHAIFFSFCKALGTWGGRVERLVDIFRSYVNITSKCNTLAAHTRSSFARSSNVHQFHLVKRKHRFASFDLQFHNCFLPLG